MQSSIKLLVIIDDSPSDNNLTEYFAKFDYRISTLFAMNELENLNEKPAGILINWTVFNANTAVIDQLFHRYTVPIIVISNLANEDICVQMLEAGADDFLVKPLHPRELHARISAISRRVQRSIQEVEREKEVLEFADWRLYPASRQIFNKAHQELQLSAGEYELLLAFLRQPQRILDREFLLQITKNSHLNLFDRRIDVQISRLRQKIETDAKKPALIKTIRNGGYLFTAQVFSTKESETGEALGS